MRRNAQRRVLPKVSSPTMLDVRHLPSGGKTELDYLGPLHQRIA